MANGDTIIPISISNIRKLLPKMGMRLAQNILKQNIPDLEILRLLRTKNSIEEFQKILEDPKWEDLMEVVELREAVAGMRSVPVPKSFLSVFNLQVRLAEMLTDITQYEPYLKLFIQRFDAENEVAVLNVRKGQAFLTEETEKLSHTAKAEGPIHAAARQLKGEFLKWLLERTGTDVNLRNSHMQTALAILFEMYSESLQSNLDTSKIKELITQLVKAGADFNICDNQSLLPIGHLSKRNLKEDKDTKTFVDSWHTKAGYALVEIKTEGNVRLVRFINNATNVNLTVELFEIFLRHKDVEQFQNYWPKFVVSPDNVKKVIRLLLHTAFDQELSGCVRLIIDNNHTEIFKEAKTPQQSILGLNRPCSRTKPDIQNKSKEHDLQSLLNRRVKSLRTEVETRRGVMEHQVELKGLLRKACEMGDPKVLELLVKNITDLFLLNEDPLLAVTLIKAHKIKQRQKDFLACAEYLVETQNIDKAKDDGFRNTPLHLALKYGFESVALALLKQRYAYLSYRNRDKLTPLEYGTYEFWKIHLDRCIETEAGAREDTCNIRFNLSCFEPCKVSDPNLEDKESTLMEMLQKISSVTYLPRMDEQNVTEMTPIHQIAQSKELKPLLMHPVVHTFIMVQWMRFSHWNYLNLVLTVLTAALFGSFSLTACSHEGPNKILQWGSAIAALLMAGREILQMLFLRMSYISFDNILDLSNIFAMCYVFYTGYDGLVCSLVVISLALQVTFLISSLPFHNLSTVMYMFKTISINFLRSFLLFVPLFGAFVYAFFQIYNECSVEGAKRDACTEDDCTEKNFNQFYTIWNATIKTLVMTTGELDASSMELDMRKSVLFLLFLFIVPIVIMNLINGLAVSDIVAIREKAELISLSRKVELLEQYERGIVSVCPAALRHLITIPRPFFNAYNSWIDVSAKEFRKLVVHPKHKSTNSENSKRVLCKPIPIFPLLAHRLLLEKPINVWFFKIYLFMRLDHSIFREVRTITKE